MTATTSPEVKKSVSRSAAAAAAPKGAPASKVRKSAVKSAIAPAVEVTGKTRAKAKPAAKAKVKPAVDATPQAPVTKAAKVAKNGKEKKVADKKPKLIRDSFTFPEADYALIGVLKQRGMKAGHEVKKSELLRAGLTVLSGLSDDALSKVLNGIDKLKTGRPKK